MLLVNTPLNRNALKPTGTNGDGVKPGSTSPMGLGGANVQLGRTRPRLNIFTPSPFVSELYANSCNTHSEVAACSS